MSKKILTISLILFLMLFFSSIKILYGNSSASIIKDDSINRLHCRYSLHCKVVILGKSREGQVIYGYIIGNINDDQRQTKRIDIISGMHGNEQTAVFFTNNLFNMLLDGYNPNSKNMYYIIALSNPAAIIKNKRLISEDLNRVFVNNQKIDSPEEAAILNFLNIDKNKFELSSPCNLRP